jgi:DNA-binding CsgD family transcriptional regulator
VEHLRGQIALDQRRGSDAARLLLSAALMIEENHLIAEATGNPPVADTEVMLAAWRGRGPEASALIEATVQEAAARGLGRLASFAAYASSVLYNGLGRHDAARDPRGRHSSAAGWDTACGLRVGRAGGQDRGCSGRQGRAGRLSERTRVRPTDWALGIEAQIRALLSEGETADSRYRESLARLARTRMRVELARAHLLYGEWLRRQRRRSDAREQLRTAHSMLEGIGAEAFAERARRELLTTGERVRRRTVETSGELTAQEAQIARLAREGLSNPEIGTRLFLSAHTVQYHLRKVFAKLGITSRSQLDRVLPAIPASADRPRLPPGP